MALKAKTGSIEGVYALSGILGEDEIAFSIIINNFYGPSRLMDQKVEQMLRSWLEN
jgi:D-alanyl-D-alanine carboxypeptidase